MSNCCLLSLEILMATTRSCENWPEFVCCQIPAKGIWREPVLHGPFAFAAVQPTFISHPVSVQLFRRARRSPLYRYMFLISHKLARPYQKTLTSLLNTAPWFFTGTAALELEGFRILQKYSQNALNTDYRKR